MLTKHKRLRNLTPQGKGELSMRYTVKNIYGIAGESNHKSPELAIKARDKREGSGWVVVDSAGNTWDMYGDIPVVTETALDI